MAANFETKIAMSAFLRHNNNVITYNRGFRALPI